MKDNIDECKGCKSCIDPFSTQLQICFYNMQHIHFIDNCPCRKCLIKVMCNTLCKEFKEQRYEQIRRSWYKTRKQNSL